MRENPSYGFENNNVLGQPMHPRSLINAFIIC